MAKPADLLQFLQQYLKQNNIIAVKSFNLEYFFEIKAKSPTIHLHGLIKTDRKIESVNHSATSGSVHHTPPMHGAPRGGDIPDAFIHVDYLRRRRDVIKWHLYIIKDNNTEQTVIQEQAIKRFTNKFMFLGVCQRPRLAQTKSTA